MSPARKVPPAAVLRSRLKARQLALVVAIAERGSLRRAALDLAVTQPAATRMLAELEDALGVALFERAAWGMQPTLYGETLIRCARGVLTDLAQVRDEIAAIASGARGVVRAGAETGNVPGLLVPALARVRAAHPGVRAYLLVNSSDVLVAALARGELDVALGRLPPDTDADEFDVRPLAQDRLCVVAGAGHPLAGARRVDATSLEGATWVLHPPDSGMRAEAAALLGRAGLRPGRDVIETVSIVATLALLQSGDALAVLPWALAGHYASRGLLVRLPLETPGAVIETDIITRRRRALAPAAQALCAALDAVAEEAADGAARRPQA